MQRPDHLPDFDNPPLNEVVLGVQFTPPVGYQQIRSGEVWALFKSDYPVVQEQPALEPTFETFGLPQTQFGGRLSLVTGATHDRFWFVRSNGEELVQFQQDRLLHNWRKVGDRTNQYPRFESMAQKFREELEKLEGYLNGLHPQVLAINQCEVTYINHIDVDNGALDLSSWFNGLTLGGINPDDYSIGFREVIRNEQGQPTGRITYEIATGLRLTGERMIVFNLIVRGAPSGPDIASALRFIAQGRELIVKRFAEITTRQAHTRWERRA